MDNSATAAGRAASTLRTSGDRRTIPTVRPRVSHRVAYTARRAANNGRKKRTLSRGAMTLTGPLIKGQTVWSARVRACGGDISSRRSSARSPHAGGTLSSSTRLGPFGATPHDSTRSRQHEST